MMDFTEGGIWTVFASENQTYENFGKVTSDNAAGRS